MNSPSSDRRVDRLVERFRAGKKTALARAISVVEGERPGAGPLLHRLLCVEPTASRVGLTGPPGAGKSSLVAALSALIRAREEVVGVVAVDPTSPYSGGALLGDRIRMNDLATDPGMFIRSMATRGSLGGLAGRTREVVDLMDAFGLAHVLIETVGVGQTELEIASAADTVVVVLVPESGDSIQAMKAGLMEIADIFVVNKSDRPGADRLMRDLQLAIHMRTGRGLAGGTVGVTAHHGLDLEAVGITSEAGGDETVAQVIASPTPSWEIPVLKTSAGRGEGIDDLDTAIRSHREFLVSSGELARRREARAAGGIREVLRRSLVRAGEQALADSPQLAQWARDIVAGSTSPYAVAETLIGTILRNSD